MKSLHLTGKRWFQKTYGNTYFSAKALIDGEIATAIDFEYGYGDHCLDCLMNKLEKEGFITDREENESAWRYCARKEIIYTYNVSDVERKRDL